MFLNSFCGAIIRRACRKESSVSFSLGLSNVQLASFFRIRFYWEKKDILFNFF